MKLSTELSKRSTGRTMYILDEPTTGLSFEDTRALLEVLQRLVDGGNTVVVIEHHMDVVKNADHIIDLGPAGGDRGGRLIATGTPEEVALVQESATAEYLRRILPPERIAAAKKTADRNGTRNGARAPSPAKSPVQAKAPRNGAISSNGAKPPTKKPVATKNGKTPTKKAAAASARR